MNKGVMIIDTTYDVKTILGKFHYGTTSSSYSTYPDFLSENVFHQHDMIKGGLQSVILKDYGTNMNVSKN